MTDNTIATIHRGGTDPPIMTMTEMMATAVVSDIPMITTGVVTSALRPVAVPLAVIWGNRSSIPVMSWSQSGMSLLLLGRIGEESGFLVNSQWANGAKPQLSLKIWDKRLKLERIRCKKILPCHIRVR
jgi:hypothetical protein